MNLPGFFVYEGDFLRDAVCRSDFFREGHSGKRRQYFMMHIAPSREETNPGRPQAAGICNIRINFPLKIAGMKWRLF